MFSMPESYPTIPSVGLQDIANVEFVYEDFMSVHLARSKTHSKE